MASDSEIKELWNGIRTYAKGLKVELIDLNKVDLPHTPSITPQESWSSDLVLSIKRNEVPTQLIREVKVLKRRSGCMTETMSEVRRDIAIRRAQLALNRALENFGNPFKES